MAKRKGREVEAVVGLTGVGVGLGVGSSVVAKAGGSAAGLGAAATFMPAVGTLLGGGMVIRRMGGLTKVVRKRRRR